MKESNEVILRSCLTKDWSDRCISCKRLEGGYETFFCRKHEFYLMKPSHTTCSAWRYKF